MILWCLNCGNAFRFTEKERRYYKEKGFHDPKRCKACRDKRKEMIRLERKMKTNFKKGA